MAKPNLPQYVLRTAITIIVMLAAIEVLQFVPDFSYKVVAGLAAAIGVTVSSAILYFFEIRRRA